MKTQKNEYQIINSWSILFVIILLSITQNIQSQQTYKFWIELTDKNNSEYSITNPSEFLSQRAIKRRYIQNIDIVESDLPVNNSYIQQIKSTGVKVLYTSKWFNALVIGTNDSSQIETVATLPFVKKIELAAIYQQLKKASNKFQLEQEFKKIPRSPENEYGFSFDQIKLHNGDWLHNEGYKGEGIHIAVIDAGFYNADIIPAFENLWSENRILGYKDFVDPEGNIFSTHSHGTNVLSIIGTNMPNEYLGTAPEASFWLLRSEDGASEMRIEEMNWIVAAEFADSVGVDVINTSLGYSTFDIPSQNYTYEAMTGNSTYVSQAAEIAASKGMLLVTSAGNEGNDSWYYITAPADADNILTIGAVNDIGEIATFSSHGPSSDGRIKPDIVSVGWGTALVSTNGDYVYGNGTSFSAPMTTGLVTCLWQAFPEAKNTDIVNAVRFSSDRYNNPDASFGYGIPDYKYAYDYLQEDFNEPESFSAYLKSTSWGNYIEVKLVDSEQQTIEFEVFDINGKMINNEEFNSTTKSFQYPLNFLENYPVGIYLVKVKHAGESKTVKAIR